MILLDYNGIAVGNVITQKLEVEENLIRHMILNTIRMYNVKFRDKYGEMVICCDAGGNWRKKVYAEYKASRKDRVEEDAKFWDELFRIVNLVREEIKENLPWKVVQVWGAEADDVIATLVDRTQEFGMHEDVMIVSADKDFAQLQKYSNVQQFSPMTKKFIVEKDPKGKLFEHVCRGDGSDGVPNVLSGDNVFVDKIRQTQLRSKRIEEWAKAPDLREAMGEEIYRNYIRNQKMIDLESCPESLKSDIISNYDEQESVSPAKIKPYLMQKRCRNLLSNIQDFR